MANQASTSSKNNDIILSMKIMEALSMQNVCRFCIKKKNEFCGRFSYGFSMLEVLFALLVIGILGVSAMRGVIALKTQDYAVQKFLLKNANIFITQLFINRQLDSIDSKSIVITPTSITWKQYKDLFMEVPSGDYMDFSLNTTNATLTLQNNNLYFNNSLLLENVSSMKFLQTNTNNQSILSYEICSSVCIKDFILLDEVEKQITTKV